MHCGHSLSTGERREPIYIMQREVEQREPIEVLADDFTRRLRRGENPSIEEYQRQYPLLAAQIGELFPTIAMLERMKRKKEQKAQAPVPILDTPRPERLGDLQILREIGRGGMGIVYEAKQLSLGRHVAVKVLPAQAIQDPQRLQRFQREARTVATLHHNNIVPVFGVGEHEGIHYIVMQLIRGVGLDEVFTELQNLSGKGQQNGTNPSVRVKFASTIAQGLLHAPLAEPRLHGHQTDGVVTRTNSPQRRTKTRVLGKPEQGRDGASSKTEPLVPGQSIPSPDGHQHSRTAQLRAVPALHEPADEVVMVTPKEGQSPPPTTQDRTQYWRNVARIGLQVAEALHYAHRHQVLHRDIKPGNLLIDGRGEVWVADFGVAKSLTSENLSQTGEVVGTLRYMSPEQLNGKVEPRSDVYSLGLTLYELLTLEHAYQGDDQSGLVQRICKSELPLPRQRNRAIPRDLETIIMKACAREPSQRYATAGDLAADLQRYLDDRPIRARRVTPFESAVRWTRRNPVIASLTALIFLLLSVIAVVSSVAYARTTQALRNERIERRKTEKVLQIALEAFDEVYQRSTPRDLLDGPQFTVVRSDGQQVNVGAQPVPSEQSAALLVELLKFYDKLATIQTNNRVLQEQSARASFRIGHIYRSLGQSEKALAAYTTALSKYKELENEVGSRYVITKVRLHGACAAVYQSKGDPTKARSEFENALSVLDRRDLNLSPRDIAYEKARVYFLMGRRSAQRPDLPPPGPPPKRSGKPGPHGRDDPPPRRGRHGGGKGGKGPRLGPFAFPLAGLFGPRHPQVPSAERARLTAQTKSLREAVALLDGVLQTHPDDRECRYLLGLCHQELAGVFRTLHFHRDANKELNQSINILEKLTSDHQHVSEYQYALTQSYVMVDLGPPGPRRQQVMQHAREYLEKALHLLEQLSRDNPGHPDYVVSQVQAYRQLGVLLSHGDPNQGRKENEGQARTYLTKAVGFQKELVRRYPNVTSYRLGLIMVEQSLADLLLKTRHGREAKPLLQNAVTLIKELQRKNPDADYLDRMLEFSERALRDIDEGPPPPPAPRERGGRGPGRRKGPRKRW